MKANKLSTLTPDCIIRRQVLTRTFLMKSKKRLSSFETIVTSRTRCDLMKRSESCDASRQYPTHSLGELSYERNSLDASNDMRFVFIKSIKRGVSQLVKQIQAQNSHWTSLHKYC
ncbi:hypothetical protein PR048_005563, partial [Dryococelus australis]